MQTTSIIASSRQDLLAITRIADKLRVNDADVGCAETALASINLMLSMAMASSSDEAAVLRKHYAQAKSLVRDIQRNRALS